jgi:hypothetical protein
MSKTWKNMFIEFANPHLCGYLYNMYSIVLSNVCSPDGFMSLFTGQGDVQRQQTTNTAATGVSGYLTFSSGTTSSASSGELRIGTGPHKASRKASQCFKILFFIF